MTQDKSEEYLLTVIPTLPAAIIFALAIGFNVYAYNPQLGARILLSIPFILLGYGAFVLPIADLAGMHKLGTIGAVIYALLTVLYITLVTVLLEFYHDFHEQWVILYAAFGLVGVLVASGCTYICLAGKDSPVG